MMTTLEKIERVAEDPAGSAENALRRFHQELTENLPVWLTNPSDPYIEQRILHAARTLSAIRQSRRLILSLRRASEILDL